MSVSNYHDLFDIKTFIHKMHDTSIKMDYHFHNSYEFVYVENGDMNISYFNEDLKKESFKVFPNQVIIIAPNIKHKIVFNANTSLIVLEVTRNKELLYKYVEASKNFRNDNLIKEFIKDDERVWILNDSSKIKNKMLDLVNLENDKNNGHSLELYQYNYNTYFPIFLISIYKSLGVNLERHHSKYIDKSILYMHSNISNDISIKQIASYVGISESYLKSLFVKEMNMTIHKYLIKIRIDCAINYFKTTLLSQSEIAIKAGFKTYNTMHKCFLRENKKSAKKYQRETIKEAVQYFNNEFKTID